MRPRLCCFLLAVVSACSRTNEPKLVQTRQELQAPVRVVFDRSAEVPKETGELTVFKLTPAPPRRDFLEYLPRAQRDAAARQATIEFHPDFQRLKEYTLQQDQAGDIAKDAFSKMQTALDDDGITTIVPREARTLGYARARRAPMNGPDRYDEAKSTSLYVSLQRRVGKWPVDGPGSRFSVAVAPDRKLVGAIYYWKRPTRANSVAPLKELVVKDKIREQILTAKPESPVHVKRIELAYYDADGQFLQPVYRYVAEYLRSKSSVGRTQLVVGYIPLSSAKEVIQEIKPDLSADLITNLEPIADNRPSSRTPLPQRDTSVAIGRYVTFRDSMGFGQDAREFWRELSLATGDLQFSNAQHIETGPLLFGTRKDWFVNSVDLALVEAHGFPFGFMTFRDTDGPFDVRLDLPLDGYGMDARGRLKHWVLHSCRAVPGGVDFKEWALPWWDVFSGLSSVLGYRSSMFVEDEAGATFAKSVRINSAIVPAWLSVVASLNVYGPDGWVTKTECTNNEPMGRAAAIAVCDEGSKARVTDASRPRPDCLEAWWLNDALVTPGAASASSPTTSPASDCPQQGGPKTPYVLSSPK